MDKDYVYPDIIIYLRNTDFNLLVIELKCSCNKSEKDIYKLEKFTYHEGEFKYKLGLFLKIDKEGIKEMIWFKNGKEIERLQNLILWKNGQ